MPGAFMRGRHTMAILRMMGVTETIAETIDEYVAIAARLAKDAPWRASVGTAMAQGRRRVYGDESCVRSLEIFLDRVARDGTAT
jgi:predicted O-linked N-acetylglucosamine transferase (SPINDLY family)